MIRKIISFSILFYILMSTTFRLCGQHGPNAHDDHHFQHHKISLFTGYGLIPGAIDEEGDKKVKVIPVLGFDYDYWFNHKFALGLHSDFELSSYSIEKDHQEYINRNYAFVTALVFLYEPLHGWTLFGGPGYEFEHHENFALFKVGTDVQKSFEGGWSVGIAANYDIKKVNSSLSFGVIAGKRLGKNK